MKNDKNLKLDNTTMEKLMESFNVFLTFNNQAITSVNNQVSELFDSIPTKLKDLSFKTSKAYISNYIEKYMVPMFHYKDITNEVFENNTKDQNVRILVNKLINDNVIQLVAIPTNSNIPESKVSDISVTAMHSILDIFQDKQLHKEDKYKDALKYFTSHDFKNDKEIKLKKADVSAKKTKLHNRLNSLKQDGWHIVDSFIQTNQGFGIDEKTLVFYAFRKTTIKTKVPRQVGVLKRIHFNNNGEWSAEIDSLQLLETNWKNLAEYWTTAVKNNLKIKAELKEEFKKAKLVVEDIDPDLKKINLKS